MLTVQRAPKRIFQLSVLCSLKRQLVGSGVAHLVRDIACCLPFGILALGVVSTLHSEHVGVLCHVPLLGV